VLRITRIENSSTSVCLKIEGRLAGDSVELLESELEKALRGEASLSLDLASVDFASPQAAELLKAAKTRGVRVSACSPYLSNLLSTRTA
jgi:anti-anti-sigma regulatory factor